MQELSVYNNIFLCYLAPMTKRMGRPKLPPKERKTEVFSIRVTKDELAQINAAAKRAGAEPRDWAKTRLLSSAG